jgi:hypothetical protein
MGLGVFGAQPVVPFDAYDRQDNDGGGFDGSIDTPEAYDALIVGKLENVAHGGGPAIRPLPAQQRTPSSGADASTGAQWQVSGMQG